jgi:hypothetical protein
LPRAVTAARALQPEVAVAQVRVWVPQSAPVAAAWVLQPEAAEQAQESVLQPAPVPVASV